MCECRKRCVLRDFAYRLRTTLRVNNRLLQKHKYNIYTAISTWRRRNELLGLRWRGIDLDMNYLLARFYLNGMVYANLINQ